MRKQILPVLALPFQGKLLQAMSLWNLVRMLRKMVAGLYNPFIGNIYAFLYRATSSSWWYTAYHHEVIHKVLHQNSLIRIS